MSGKKSGKSQGILRLMTSGNPVINTFKCKSVLVIKEYLSI